MNAEYPLRFTNSVINEFQRDKDLGYKSFTTQPVELLNLSYPLKYPNEIK